MSKNQIPISDAAQPRRDTLKNMSMAYIGMGANLSSPAGPPEDTLAAAAVSLESLGRVLRRSSLYSTEPVGFAAQPRFLNTVVALETNLNPRALLDGLLSIEREFGRDRSSAVQNGPRTLDLDILLCGAFIISEPGLEIPHPRLAERAFVLIPLNEIAPFALDARSGATVSQLLQNLHLASESITNAVVRLESQVWRAGAVGGRIDSGNPSAA
jgi:2-amino-4-hydroxy-6-hydroxymethyldihydropteridine diphosphokinase